MLSACLLGPSAKDEPWVPVSKEFMLVVLEVTVSYPELAEREIECPSKRDNTSAICHLTSEACKVILISANLQNLHPVIIPHVH